MGKPLTVSDIAWMCDHCYYAQLSLIRNLMRVSSW